VIATHLDALVSVADATARIGPSVARSPPDLCVSVADSHLSLSLSQSLSSRSVCICVAVLHLSRSVSSLPLDYADQMRRRCESVRIFRDVVSEFIAVRCCVYCSIVDCNCLIVLIDWFMCDAQLYGGHERGDCARYDTSPRQSTGLCRRTGTRRDVRSTRLH
jgi:hypothetical protein